MSKISNRELAERVERTLLIDALQSDARLTSYREVSERLNRVLVAWLRDSNPIKEIARLVGVKTSLQGRYKASDLFADINPGEFDAGFLDWFDELLISLKPWQNEMMKYEAIHYATKERGHGMRNRADIWANKYSDFTVKDYHPILRDTREQIVIAILNKF